MHKTETEDLRVQADEECAELLNMSFEDARKQLHAGLIDNEYAQDIVSAWEFLLREPEPA